MSFAEEKSQDHFPHVLATTMRTIFRRICHKGRNDQRSLISSHGKGRGMYIPGTAIFTWHADLRGAEPYAIAQRLPDDILLEIFKFHQLASLSSGTWKWYKFAQVCRRWRFVVFAYPRIFESRIVISTNTNRIRETPYFWPVDLPIAMRYRSQLSVKDEQNIFRILKNPARICEMDIDMTSFLLKYCASLLEQSFPALEYLRLGSQGTANGGALVFPEKFLGNSAPRLRVIRLQDTVFPSLPRLLSASQNLVSLQLENIPDGGIFTAQELAVGLSPATQLKSLKIGIHGAPFLRPSRKNYLEPRLVLPALLEFEYVGETPYLNDFASRIDTPIIERIDATFVGDYYGYDPLELCKLFSRVEELGSSHRHTTHIRFFEDRLFEESVAFEHHYIRSTTSSPVSFRLRLLDPNGLRNNIVFVENICLGFLCAGIMRKVTRIEIEGFSASSRWYTKEDWHSFLCYLRHAERLYVAGTPLVSSLVSALVDVSEEETVPLNMATLLPALLDLHLPDGFGRSVMEPFVAARRLYGLPLSVHYKGLRLDSHDHCSDEN